MVSFGRLNLQDAVHAALPRSEQFRGSLYVKSFSEDLSLIIGPFEMLRLGVLAESCSVSRGSCPSPFILVDGGEPSQPTFTLHISIKA